MNNQSKENNIAEKSTAFLIDELITTNFRIRFSESDSERYWEQIRRKSLLKEAIKERTGEDNSLFLLIVNLGEILRSCWEAQEVIMDSKLTAEERLEGAINAQLENSRRADMIRQIDTILGEGDRTQPKKTYTYFEEGADE